MNIRFFYFKTLDQETRWMGLPLDELLPAVLIGFILFFLGQSIFALLIGAAWVIFLKHMKKGQGTSWLLSVLYWHLGLGKGFFIKIPSAKWKHWMS